MGEKVKEVEFELPDEKVTVKYIKRSVGIAANVPDNHIISGGMLEKAYKKLPVPMLRSGSLKNVLTKPEKAYFEKHYSIDNLSMYHKFWDDKYVRLEKSNVILNLSDEADYISYKILLGWNTIVAPSLKEYKENPTPALMFYMEREGEAGRIKSKSLNITKTAWKNFNQIEDNREILSAVVFLMSGKKLASNATLEYMNTEVERLVDSKPENFNELIGDPQFESKIFVANAERAGLIKKIKGAYETTDGFPVTEKGRAATIDNVVLFFNDPMNLEVRDLILSRLDNQKE